MFSRVSPALFWAWLGRHGAGSRTILGHRPQSDPRPSWLTQGARAALGGCPSTAPHEAPWSAPPRLHTRTKEVRGRRERRHTPTTTVISISKPRRVSSVGPSTFSSRTPTSTVSIWSTAVARQAPNLEARLDAQREVKRGSGGRSPPGARPDGVWPEGGGGRIGGPPRAASQTDAFPRSPCPLSPWEARRSPSRQAQQGAGHHRFAVVGPRVGEPQIPEEVSLTPVG